MEIRSTILIDSPPLSVPRLYHTEARVKEFCEPFSKARELEIALK
jgi:hypothetical protein